jgi:hypothetical protein
MNDLFNYSNENSLSKLLCDEIIELFDQSPNKYEGATLSGLNKDIKNTYDFIIPKNDIVWSRIYNLLENELTHNIQNYVAKCKVALPDHYNLFSSNLLIDSIQIQKYNNNIGKYIYHNDAHVDNKKIRILTFIWYLNDVLDGGETEFLDFKIVPKVGTLIIFPATWTYPHKANVPISSDKYIMTGWLYNYF